MLPLNNEKVAKKSSTTAPTGPIIGSKLDVKTLSFSETFQCQAKDLYDVFTQTPLASAFTHGPAQVEPSRGGEFVLFGGNITGKFEELVRNEKIVQTWRYKQWPSGHYSQVTLEFVQKVSRQYFTFSFC